MAAEAPVPGHAQEVVHESEEAEPERGEQDEAAGQREAGLVPQAGPACDRAPGFDDEHGEHDDDPAGGRQRNAAVVGPLERRELQHVAARDAQEPRRDDADDDADEDAHARVTAAGAGSESGGTGSLGGTRRYARTMRTTMTGVKTLSIMPGIAIPESLAANPRVATIAKPTYEARSSGTQSTTACSRLRRFEYT